MDSTPKLCFSASWARSYREQRSHPAPPLRHVIAELMQIWRKETQPDYTQLCSWYAQRQGIHSAGRLAQAASWRFPGICLGTAQTLIQRLRANRQLDLAAELAQWPAMEHDAVFLSLIEVFRYAIDVDRIQERNVEAPQQALARLVPQAPLRVWVRQNHLDCLAIALEDCDDCAVILRYSAQAGQRGVGHAYLLVFRSELQRYEFLDTTTGKGLYRFSSREELLAALRAYFVEYRSAAICGKNWIFDYFPLRVPGKLQGGPRLSSADDKPRPARAVDSTQLELSLAIPTCQQ